MFGKYKLTISYLHILPTLFQIFGEKGEVKTLTYTPCPKKIVPFFLFFIFF